MACKTNPRTVRLLSPGVMLICQQRRSNVLLASLYWEDLSDVLGNLSVSVSCGAMLSQHGEILLSNGSKRLLILTVWQLVLQSISCVCDGLFNPSWTRLCWCVSSCLGLCWQSEPFTDFLGILNLSQVATIFSCFRTHRCRP